MIELRPYQETARSKVSACYQRGMKRVLLVAPTGSGKGTINCDMMRRARDRGFGAMFLVRGVELIKQASERLSSYGLEHGVLQGENTHSTHMPLLVASIDTVARRGVPQQIRFIALDEAHDVAGSANYHNLFRQLSNVHMCGTTATPFARGLGKSYPDIGPLWEEMVIAATVPELIEQGYLVDADVYAPVTPNLKGVRTTAGDYNEDDLARVCNTKELIGDTVRYWLRLAKGTPTLLYAVNIAHSKSNAERFMEAGITAEHIDCYMSESEQDAIMDRYESGETTVLCNVLKLGRGYDSPKTRTIVMSRPTKSLTVYLQQAGRAFRPFPGKDRWTLIDHAGNVCRLGWPTGHFHMELDRGNRPEKEERKEPLPKLCGARVGKDDNGAPITCGAVRQPKEHACPKCGFAPTPQSGVDARDGTIAKVTRKAKIATADKEIVYAELLGYARSKGFKDGYAWHAVKELFGSAPKNRLEAREPTASTMQLVRHLQIKRAHSREMNAR